MGIGCRPGVEDFLGREPEAMGGVDMAARLGVRV
jgi:hypothetical protein